MAKSGKFYHATTNNTAVAAVGTSFNAGKNHKHELVYSTPLGTTSKFLGKVEGFTVKVNTIAGGSGTPTLTLRGATDATGDNTWFPDTAGQLALGISTATIGVAAYEFKLPLNIETSDDVYLFFKIDQGSCTIEKSTITWSE
jgi:hypothetical protein